DTNSTLAAALAAAKLHIPVAHVESGLRSRNKSMPEEINRVLTDHASMFLFCPTKTAVRNLQQEGFSNPLFEGELAPLGFEEPDRIASVDAPWVVNVGDVMYDSVLQHVCRAKARGFTDPTLRSLAVNHAVLTVHRADNTDNAKLLRSILEAAQSIAQDGIAVFFPIHPRTRQAIKRASLDSLLAGLMSVEPVSYYDMLLLVQRAEFVLTDSGGLQREAFMLGTPCVTLRRETEWVELLDTGISELGGTDPKEILDAVDRVRGATVKGPVSPYGDGHAAQRIMAAVSTWWRDAAT
ncbi:MAG: UDP-N-acetyl glucosamine 2-epimerase, partial [Candidatus Atribacteria bacterium]